MKEKLNQSQVAENLKDAGCPDNIIAQFGQAKEPSYQLEILRNYRKELLERVHGEQKKLECLDYLIFQVKDRVDMQ